MKILLAVVGVVVALLVLVAVVVGGSYVSSKNEMVRKNEAIKQAWSQVDVVLATARRPDSEPCGDGEGLCASRSRPCSETSPMPAPAC